MSSSERAEGEPECRRLRKLTAQFVAKQQIVKRNQHDPVWQTNDADQENPCDYAAHQVRCRRYGTGRFQLRLAQRTRNQGGDDRRQRSQTVEPVVEHGERRGPTETVDADNRNQIARNHGPRMGPRCQLAEMLRERRRRDRSHSGLFLRLRHFNRLADRFGGVESIPSVMATNSCLNTFVDLETKYTKIVSIVSIQHLIAAERNPL